MKSLVPIGTTAESVYGLVEPLPTLSRGLPTAGKTRLIHSGCPEVRLKSAAHGFDVRYTAC
jgi:hypothetical protein